MVLFPKNHLIYKGHLKHFNPEEIVDIPAETKHVKMAELAGIE